MNTVLVGILVPLIAAIISGSGIGLWTYRTTNRRHDQSETEARKARNGGMNGYTFVIKRSVERIEELQGKVEELRVDRDKLKAEAGYAEDVIAALRHDRTDLVRRLQECEQRQKRPARPRKTS